MKSTFHVLFGLLLIGSSFKAAAQNSDDARALVKEGRSLNDAGKYADAIEKYRQALKIDTGNLYADFQMAFSLFQFNKGNEAIPYIQKVINGNNNLSAGAYDLLGSVYDKNHQTKEAIEAYKEGINANPKFQRLYYNLGIVYSRGRQYADAEKCATDAIKLEPTHASSMRMYALVTFHQNKRAAALLGLCSFILLEPNTARSAEAFGNIQHILQGGALKPEPGVAIANAVDPNTFNLNQAITQAVAEAAKSKHTTAADELAAQLKGIFININSLVEKHPSDSFFDKYLAAYFYKLAQSPNMPAFARLISQSTPESAKWIKDNPQQMAALDGWVKTTERGF